MPGLCPYGHKHFIINQISLQPQQLVQESKRIWEMLGLGELIEVRGDEQIMTTAQTKKAYQEIIAVLNKHKNTCVYDVDALELKAKLHLYGIELKEFGLNIDPKDISSLTYNRFGNYMSIGMWGKNYRRTIGCSDNNKQPNDELLLSISFSTGAYIFGDDYPTELFQEFWEELIAYNPTYTDKINSNLYFSIDTAKDIFNNFQAILNKYNEKNKIDAKKRRIAKLKIELQKCEEQQV